MPVIISNDPDVIALQRLEAAEDHYLSQITEVVVLMVNGTITPAEGRERTAKLRAWWKREMEEIKKIGDS